MITKIVSGGQTGADRIALQYAKEHGLDYGGFIPNGRRAEDGIVPLEFEGLIETESAGFTVRTEKNVLHSDGTLIVTPGTLNGGSLQTAILCNEHNISVYIAIITETVSLRHLTQDISCWVHDNFIKILNVAGPRASKIDDLSVFKDNVYQILDGIFADNAIRSFGL